MDPKRPLSTVLGLWALIAGTVVAAELPPETRAFLMERGWDERVGDARGIWVDARTQRLLLIEKGRVLRVYRCATGAAGLGNQRNSGKTPLGWHRVGAKIGDKLPVGAVLKARRWTRAVWTPGKPTDADLVLTRILWLRGLEPGKNLGGSVDTWSRYIYIHGTNHVAELGRPSSHGCVRLDPREVISLFDLVPKNTRVLITGPAPPAEAAP